MNYRKAIPVLLSFPTALAAALLLVVIGVDGAVPPYEAKSPQPGQAQKQSSRRYADGPAPPLAPATCPSGGYDPTIPGCGAVHIDPPGTTDYSKVPGGNPNAGPPVPPTGPGTGYGRPPMGAPGTPVGPGLNPGTGVGPGWRSSWPAVPPGQRPPNLPPGVPINMPPGLEGDTYAPPVNPTGPGLPGIGKVWNPATRSWQPAGGQPVGPDPRLPSQLVPPPADQAPPGSGTGYPGSGAGGAPFNPTDHYPVPAE